MFTIDVEAKKAESISNVNYEGPQRNRVDTETWTTTDLKPNNPVRINIKTSPNSGNGAYIEMKYLLKSGDLEKTEIH